MKLTVKNVFKLDDDYDEIFINRATHTKGRFTQIQMSSRTIKKIQYDDIYMLEPHCMYYITFYEEFDADILLYSFVSDLLESGLIYNYDISQHKLYVYNCNENIIYLQHKTNLLQK